MDFWSRLIGGTSRQNKQSSPKKSNDPQQRLDRFRRVYHSVLQTCSQPQRLGQPGPLIEQLVVNLRQLCALLREELRSPAPYTCLSFANSSQIYAVIGRAASACKDERVILEAVNVFSILIDSEMESFVSSRSFARALMRFSMRVLDAGHTYIGPETESQLVEVLFNIAAKIRLESDILPVWFAPSGRAGNDEEFLREKKSFVGITQKDDFPLCYLFIDRVHSEGRIGDFARTGLLYIFEAASRAPTLDAWIVASDLPTLMASALGALYSQLSRELSLLQDPSSLPMLLAMSDYLDHNQDTGVETISSESHKSHMTTFLSDLTFWQDILDHCRAVDVKQTLLDHFQILFLQQLLYPSLLESSDTDGGSSVAVMTYLNSILQTLTDEGLSNMLLTYLLATQASERTPANRPPSPSVIRRRSSLMQLTLSASGDDRFEPSLFNLVDLIHNGLQSRNSQTTFAALKLFTTILTLQPSHAFGTLIRLNKDYRAMPERTVGALKVEASTLMNVAGSIGGFDGIDEAFSGASYDVRKNIEAISLRRAQAAHGLESRNNSVVFTELHRNVSKSMLDLNDTSLRSILNLVRRFLANGVDTNLALTETLMAICTSMSIDVSDLLAIRADSYAEKQSQDKSAPHPRLKQTWLDDEETTALQSIASVNQPPSLDQSNTPAILSALKCVEAQVKSLRESLSRFDALLSKRKAILQTPQQIDALFSSPVKVSTKPKTPALSLSRHASPSPVPRPGSKGHVRNLSITSASSHNESPSRQGSLPPRGRRPSQNPLIPTSPTSTPPIYKSPQKQATHSRQQSIVASPARSLNANVFRPPPPEPNTNLSPPRMGTLSPPKSPPRNASITSDRHLSPSPFQNQDPNPFAPVDHTASRYTASPGAGGENDAETLNLRVRFNDKGEIVGIGPPGSKGGSVLGSGARSPAVGLAGRLRGEVVPGSSRGSSVPGGDTPARQESRERGQEGSKMGTEVPHSEDEDDLRMAKVRDPPPQEGEDQNGAGEGDLQTREVSLSHVLTNIVVLQNFILELVAVLQHRARIYDGEVRFH